MRKKSNLLVSIVALVFIFTIVAGCAPTTDISSQPQPDQTEAPIAIDGVTLLNQRCTACHSLERVESKHKTLDEWSKTVSRMVEKGAVLNAEEINALVEHLAKTYGP